MAATPIEILSLDELNRLTRGSASERQTNNVQNNEDQLWPRLLATVHSSQVSDKHLTAACNAVCFHIKIASAGRTGEAKSSSTSTVTWRQIFQVVRRAFTAGKSKPALQVLDTLASLTAQLPQKQDAIEVVEEAVYEMATIVYTQQSRQSLKEACIVLYFFLRKLSDFMSATKVFDRALEDSFATYHRICASASISTYDLNQQNDRPWLHFIISLLLAASVSESKSAALKLLSLLCTNNPNLEYPDLVFVTGKAIDIYSATKPSALDEITTEVFPAVLISSERYHAFFAKEMSSSDSSVSKLEVVLGVLAYGKSRNYITEYDLPNLCSKVASRFMTGTMTHDDVDGIQLLLSHTSAGVRLRVLSLILASTSPNIPLAAETFKRLMTGLPYLHNDTDAFYRGEILSIFRRFLIRLQHSHQVFTKHESESSLEDQHAYATFCLRYSGFLTSEISAHHTYGRNVLALNILSLITEKFWPHGPFNQIDFAEEGFLSTLFQLSVNPYDDIRMLSVLVLRSIIIAKGLNTHLSLALRDTLSHVSLLAARTNRADHADALGRLIALSQGTDAVIEQGDQQFEKKLHDLTRLVTDLVVHTNALNHFDVTSRYPLHGNLLGIKYVLEGLQTHICVLNTTELRKQLLLVARKLWILSLPHLCVDSPETETDQSEEVDHTGPKDTLAYAWRALRDSNLMMQAMLSTFGHDQQVISTIGSLCFNQLTRLRHRGAFSTVAQTFVLCCQKSRTSSSADIQGMTSAWFAAALKELINQAEKLTRRSAGLPAMFVALLDSEDSHNFSTNMSELIKLATATPPETPGSVDKDKLQLPQVHALNCLKDIMTNSRFRTMTEALVVPMIELAAQCMKSHIWAVKNCGLMLFRASINRLDPDSVVGPAQAGINVQSSFYCGMRPIDVAFSLLAISHSSEVENGIPSAQQALVGDESTTEPIFAGLDLMGRLYIEKSDKSKALHCVSQHTSSNIWHVRTQVARLLVDMISPDEEAAFMTDTLDSLNHCTNSNERHCRLLIVQGLLARFQTNSAAILYQQEFAGDLAKVCDSIWEALNGDNCALWLEIVGQVHNLRSADSPGFQKLKFIHEKRLSDSFRHTFQSRAIYDRALAQALIQSYIDESNLSLDLVVQYIGSDDDIITHAFQQPLSLLSFAQFNHYFNIVLAILPIVKKEEARAAVIETVVACLGLEFQLDYKPQVATLVETLNFDQRIARTSLMLQLSLYTALCRTTWLRDTEIFMKLQRLSSGYCQHLRFAANDQIEDSTRWAAVKSLQQWQKISSLDAMLQALFDPKDELELFLIIYDLLNDDDEDIRATTTRIATSCCQSSTTTHQETSTICALASRELLRDRIELLFSKDEQLILECLKRLLDCQGPLSRHGPTEDLVQYCQHYTVEERILELTAVANDLFAEEKQNLYIDEVEELIVWSQMFKRTKCRLPGQLVGALFTWVSEGLRSIQRLLAGVERRNGHLNISDGSTKMPGRDTSMPQDMNHDIDISQGFEVLILRVVAIADMLLETENDEKGTEVIHKLLTQLRLTCQEYTSLLVVHCAGSVKYWNVEVVAGSPASSR